MTTPSEVITFSQAVTPELAKEYLAKNTHNRPVQLAHVRALAADMRAGRWHNTHQGIAFSADGVLLDGQHRLLAIIEAGTTVVMLITMGLDPEALFGIDINKARTVAQNVGLQGHQYSKAVTAWANIVKVIFTAGTERSWKTEDVIRIYKENPVTIRMATSIPDVYKRTGAIGAAYLLAGPKDQEGVHAFFKLFLSGEGLAAGSPALTAHKYFFTSNKRDTDKRWEAAIKILRCVQAHLDGTSVDEKHLYISDGTVDYFGKSHSPNSLLGEAYAARKPINKRSP